eukprot:TRINITY_DN50529_c0_g1_i1.p2 TRINITY_DN50529_c0_g1~~TRINITY_DN50529_c0_g1_i1.p2  ORF type:complete len:307 (+),score=101.78 TRINITY_DN50529_c0_g1_i1:79-921(+)
MAATAAPDAAVRGRVCVVTGGASGIGAAMCRRFHELGAKRVVVADMNEAAAKEVAASVGGIPIRCNCAQEMDVRRLIIAAEAAAGPIDVFVANAGIPANGGPEVPNDEWERIIGVNVMQHVYVARHLFPLWQARPGVKHFVITASAAGLLTQVGSLPYAVTKHGAVAVAEYYAISYAEHGIKVSCLCPQAVETGMTSGAGSKSAGSVAGLDGVLPPAKVAAEVSDAMAQGRFLILPHPEVLTYFRRKADNYDRWITGMRRLHGRFGKQIASSPNLSAAKL